MVELKKEQRDAVFHDEGDLLVSASAGSGKTFVMITRLIRLIKEKKADVSQILAMTFTESAATDMKEKLKKALIKEAVDNKDEYLLSQIRKVGTADISTIHAFCARLVRVYFHEAGVSHDFGVAEGLQSESLKKEAIDKTFKYFYSNGDEVFKKVSRWHASNRADKEFKKILTKLYEFFNSEADPEVLMNRYLDMYSKDGLNRFTKELLYWLKKDAEPYLDKISDLLDIARSFNKPKLYSFISDVQSVILHILGIEKYEDLVLCKTLKVPMATEKNLDEVEEDVKTQCKELRDAFLKMLYTYTSLVYEEEKLGEIRLQLLEHAECIVRTLKKFKEYYSELKKEENLLDFDDLEHYALKVLSNDKVLEVVKEKYKYLFIDEYQDVNGVQETLINLIGRNNVFMVGDLKQSIYGFRGCRSDFFLNKYEKMSKVEGQTASLNHSFRSANAVIDGVNKVFCYSMKKENFGLDYDTTSKLVAGGIYPDGADGRCELHFLRKPETPETEKENPRIYNLLDEINSSSDEATKISMLVSRIINEEITKTYYDTKDKEYKPISFKDIAVLTRRKDDESVMQLISGLKAHGIPVVTDASENILDYPEIRTAVSIVKLIDCFLDDVSLATVLKSPVGGFTDEDLYEISKHFVSTGNHKKRGFCGAYEYSLEDENSPVHEKVKEFDEYFSNIRDLADFMPIGDIVSKIIKDKSIEAFLYATPDGENKVKRLRRFISFINGGGKPYTAKEVLSLLAQSEKGLSFLPVDQADAVTVMTIHGSKGLEFPVVIVCGLEKEMGIRHESEEFLKDRDDGIAIKLFTEDRHKKETLWRKVFQKRMRLSVINEEMRILYVALTRPTYSLHMIHESKEDLRGVPIKDIKRYIDCIPESMPQTVHEYGDFDFEETSRGVRKVIIGEEDKDLTERMKKDFSFVYNNEEDTTLPLKSSVTSAMASDEPVYVMFDFCDGKTDKESGIIAHKFMEHAHLNSTDAYLEGQRLTDLGVISKDELDKIDLDCLNKVFTSGVLKTSENSKIYREKSFLCNIEANKLLKVDTTTPVLMQGVIDLLILEDDGARIIDYKYSSKSKESLKEVYSRQLDLYAYAVKKALNVPVKEKIIISLLSGEVIKID